MRELGRVVRTIFLLRYISEYELGQAIQAATNKSERFNEFVQRISFRGDHVIADDIRDEQRKFIKYNPFGREHSGLLQCRFDDHIHLRGDGVDGRTCRQASI